MAAVKSAVAIKSGRRYHIAATKGYLVGLVQRLGAKDVLLDWDGTDEEAVAAIYDDPRTVFALDCDNHDAEGHCLGHAKR